MDLRNKSLKELTKFPEELLDFLSEKLGWCRIKESPLFSSQVCTSTRKNEDTHYIAFWYNLNSSIFGFCVYDADAGGYLESRYNLTFNNTDELINFLRSKELEMKQRTIKTRLNNIKKDFK